MPCTSPIKGYRGPGGIVKMTHVGAWTDRHITISCGQCSSCRLERSRQWAVRMMHEAQTHDENCFITLTYDQVNLPDNGQLVVKHWQDFAKRTRKSLGPFRFYHCGEYGDESGRPHYHAAIFGQDFRPYTKYSEHRGNSYYTSALLTELWGKGLAIIGELTFQSAAYVARYVMKKKTGKQAAGHYERFSLVTGEVFNLKPEYTTMSRRPGIGKPWLDKYSSDVYPSDEVIVAGKSTRPPKFYDTQLDQVNPDLLEMLKKRRVKTARKHRANNTPERLAVRETIQKLKLAKLLRTL